MPKKSLVTLLAGLMILITTQEIKAVALPPTTTVGSWMVQHNFDLGVVSVLLFLWGL